MNQEPIKPSEDQCCGQGCKTCVFDLYEQEMAIWRKSQSSQSDDGQVECSMTADAYTECTLKSMQEIVVGDSSSVVKFQFELPPGTRFSFQSGQHLVAREEDLVRPFTLLSRPGKMLSQFQVLIKLYKKGEMSRVIANRWKPGEKVQWRGPLGSINYKPNTLGSVLLIAAGTGIVPLYQLADRIVENEDDETRVTLLYACRAYDEILLQPELHRMQNYWNFKVRYFLSRCDRQQADSARKHNEDVFCNRITREDLEAEISSLKSSSFRVFVCGPRAFERHMIDWLKDSGVQQFQIDTF